MQRMKELGCEPYEEMSTITRRVNTVYVGQYPELGEAIKVARKLEGEGFYVSVKIDKEGPYSVGVQSFVSRAAAENSAQHLQALGYPAWVQNEVRAFTVYLVMLGHYNTYREAKIVHNRIRELGFESTLVRD